MRRKLFFFHFHYFIKRYGQWTGADYYQTANKNYHESEEKRIKLQNLERRREKLRKLLTDESLKHEQDIKGLNFFGFSRIFLIIF